MEWKCSSTCSMRFSWNKKRRRRKKEVYASHSYDIYRHFMRVQCMRVVVIHIGIHWTIIKINELMAMCRVIPFIVYIQTAQSSKFISLSFCCWCILIKCVHCWGDVCLYVWFSNHHFDKYSIVLLVAERIINNNVGRERDGESFLKITFLFCMHTKSNLFEILLHPYISPSRTFV